MSDEHDAILAELRYIREGIREIKEGMCAVDNRVRQNEKDIAGLKVKAGVWGAIGGAVSALGAYLGIGAVR